MLVMRLWQSSAGSLNDHHRQSRGIFFFFPFVSFFFSSSGWTAEETETLSPRAHTERSRWRHRSRPTKPTNSSFPKKKHKRRLIISSFPFPTTRYAAEQGVFKTYYSPSPTGGTWHRLSWNAMEKVEQQSSFTSWRFNEWQNKSKWIKGGVRGRSVSPTLRPEWEPSHAPVSSRFVTRDGVGRAKQQKEKQTLGRRGEISSRKKKKSPATPIVGRFNQIRVKSQKIELHFEWIKFEF